MTRRRVLGLVVAVLLSSVTTGAVAIVYTNAVDRQWCGLLVTLDDSYNGTAGARPQTEIGRRLAFEVHQRRVAADC